MSYDLLSSGFRVISSDRDFDHFVWISWRLAAFDLVNEFHTARDLAPNSVLLVQEAAVIEADEELGVS